MLSIGPVRRRVYEPNVGKHGLEERGRIGRLPKHGQEALDFSVRVKTTSQARVGIDYDDGDGVFVVFRWTNPGEFHEQPNHEIFHGYVADWRDLVQEQRNALMRAGMANLKGRII